MSYTVVETYQLLGDGRPALVTWFRWRAERRARRLNEKRLFPSFRYEAIRWGRRWAVLPFQNVARST